MLKLADVGPERPVHKHVAEDIVIDLEFDLKGRSVDELFYWSGGDRTQAVEMTIVSATGAIGGVSLVLVPRERTRIAPSVQHHDVPTTAGLPLLDLGPWKARIGNRELFDDRYRYLKEEIPSGLSIGSDGAGVFFELPGEAASAVKNGEVTFLFTNEKVLCGFTLALSRAELRRLKRRCLP